MKRHLFALLSVIVVASASHAAGPADAPKPPSIADIAATCRLAKARLEEDRSITRIEPSTDASRLAHLLIGGVTGGDYMHVVAATRQVFHVKPQGADLVGQAPDAAFPVLISRSGRTARVYFGEAWVCDVELPEQGAEVVLAWDKGLPADAGFKVREQKIGALTLADDFMRAKVGKGDAWNVESGRWWIEQQADEGAAPNCFMLQVTAEAPARMTTGEPFWNNYRLECSVSPSDKGSLGLVFGETGAASWRVALHDEEGQGRIDLVRVDGEKETVLASRAVPDPAGRWWRIGVDVAERSPARVFMDGVPVLQADLDRAAFGRVGLWAVKGGHLDDFSVRGLADLPPPGEMRPVIDYSKTFKNKPPYPNDNRDERLQRWASDTDAWRYARLARPDGGLRGLMGTALVFGDFRVTLNPYDAARVLALHDAEGELLASFDVPAAKEPVSLERTGDKLALDGKPLPGLRSGQGVRVGLYASPASPVLKPPSLFSHTFRQEFFETAPVDWLAIGGKWALTNRWQCNPIWNFFGGIGTDDVVLMSKTSFEGSQCHEFYYGMKDIFGREFEGRRYVRRDVNFSFCTNGRDLSSGYTIRFGGDNNASTQLLKQGLVVAQNDRIKFGPFVDINDLHLFWRRLRVEKQDARIRATLDDDLLFDWTDPGDEPTGGHIALWTYRNGIVYARINSSAERVQDKAAEYLTVRGQAAMGGWTSLDPFRVRLEKGQEGRVRVEDLFGGGRFAVKWDLPKDLDLNATPVVRIPFRAFGGARVNLHAYVGRRGMIVPVNAPTRNTYDVLGGSQGYAETWAPYAATPLAEPDISDRSVYDESRGVIELNLLAESQRRFPGAGPLQSLILGNTSNDGYLMAGFGGNTSASAYEVGPVQFLPAQAGK